MDIKKGSFLFCVFGIVTAILFLSASSAYAAPIDDVPVTVTQPDGQVLELFASGDEYYNWLHDAYGYTIIQDPDSGYYVYADLVDGKLIPTKHIVGKTDPTTMGLDPYLNISPEQKEEIRQTFLDRTFQEAGELSNAPTSGTITNLVVFIRFSGEAEFTDAASVYTNMLNSSVAGANSLRNYYREVSYNALTVNSTLFPTPGSTIVSYQDSHTRAYFQPYNATTNPSGYTGGDNGTERTTREHTLLRDAINHVSGLGQFPSGATIDGDNDGIVDSVTFIVSGSPTGWNSLLWPHKWNLYSYTVTINGKTVDEYAFQLQTVVNTGVLAHEMFHVLGAPDLYHYSGDGFQPVGSWDVMESDQDPPEHMGCFMKFRYGHWISSIPQISGAGTYTLNPLTSSTNNCYKIASPNSSTEYFVVEYRREASSTFENSVPGTGMLVYRINSNQDGQGNSGGPPDEVYIYRPGGTTTANGNVNTANFSSNVGRTAINDTTNPSSFLSNGSAGGLSICNIGAADSTISFNTYCNSTIPGAASLVSPTGAINDNTPTYTWNKVANSTWYYLWVNVDTTPIYKIWYTSAQANCNSTTCSVTPGVLLNGGNYTWWIQTWNDAGYGPWSNPKTFSMPWAYGFNSQFNGAAPGWQAHAGTWFIDSRQWYTVQPKTNFWPSASFVINYSNLDYQARLWRNGCISCSNSLIIRGVPTPLSSDTTWKTAYYFQYTADGWYSIWKSKGNGAWAWVKPWATSTAIVQGSAWNTLRVIARGTKLYFYINGTLVWYGSDASFSTGRAGISMYSNAVAGDQLWVDWARLLPIAASSLPDTISPEQQALNDLAIQDGGDPRFSPQR